MRTTGRSLGRWLRRSAHRFGSTLAVACGTTALAALLYRPWSVITTAPLDADGDVWLYLTYVRNILSGNLNATSRLGAPFGQHLLDYPVGNDLTHFLLVRVVGTFTSNDFLVMNITFLAGFGLVAAATELVARELGLRRDLSVVVAVLFTFVPFHFAQGEHHFVYAGYWAVPLGTLLAVWTLRGTLPLPRVVVPRGAWDRAQTRRLAILVACVLVGGTSDPYFTFFSLFLVLTAGLLASWRDRSWSRGLAGAVVGAGLATVLLATLAPAILWKARHGANPQVAVRSPGDVELFGLHISQLVLPGAQTRWPGLGSIGSRLLEVPGPGEAGSYVGTLALIGLVLATAVLLRTGIGSAGSTRRAGSTQLPRDLALLAWSALLWATIGGLSGILAAVGFTQLRTWSRMSIYLSLCGLLALASILQTRHRALLDRRRPATFAALGLVLVIGLVDQVPATVPPSLDRLSASVDSIRATVDQMDHTLPADAMVFELPVMSFPEASTINVIDSTELLIPYLVDHGRLRWSFGGLRGREADWQLNWGQAPPLEMVRGLALAGYDAVYVDRRGFADGGAEVEGALATLVGPPSGTSPDGRQSWYDLRPLRRSLSASASPAELAQARRLLLHSATARIDNAQPPPKPPNPAVAQWFESPSRIVVHNPLPGKRTVTMELVLSAVAPSQVQLDGPGVHRTIEVATGPKSTAVRMTVPGGDTTLTVTTDAPLDYDAPRLRVQPVITATVRVDRLMMTDQAVTDLVG